MGMDGEGCGIACLLELGAGNGIQDAGAKAAAGGSPTFPVDSADPRPHLVARSSGLLVTPSQTKAGMRKYVRIAHWAIRGPRLRV